MERSDFITRTIEEVRGRLEACRMERSDFTTGKIKEVFRDAATAKFEWAVPNYVNLPRTAHLSPTVQYFNVTWHLKIDTYRDSHFVHLGRTSPTPGFLGPVRFTVACKKADGSEVDIARNGVFPVNVENLCWRHVPFRYLSSSGVLTFTCTLWRDNLPYEEVVSRVTQVEGASCTGGRIDEHPLKGVSRATQIEDGSCTNRQINEDHSKDISILLEHLKDLRLSGDDHDFLLKVRGKQFRAHKCVLRARSPVFAAMFRSQMTESADDSVTIDDCDPDAFGEFLSYVYTGKADISSASLALGLYYAGDKYDFPRLKEMSVEFLKNSLTATRISDIVNLAVTYDEGELLQQALVYLATHLEQVLRTVEWQHFLVTNPIQANEMCIKALQCVKKA